MSNLPDISEWYTPDTLNREEIGWVLNGYYKKHLAFILPRMQAAGVKSILEVGCGSGLVALGLPPEVEYLGVDRNATMLKRARARVPEREFVLGDVRHLENVRHGQEWALGMAWTFMKHFSLDEWDDILARFLSVASYGAFNVQTLNEDMDTGKDYHHVFVTEKRVAQAVGKAGHEIVDREVANEWPEGGETGRDVMYWTKRRTQ